MGGISHSGRTNRTWFFDLGTKTWTSGPDLIVPRWQHACGSVSLRTTLIPGKNIEFGEPVVVVAGGWDSTFKSLKSTEVWSPIIGKWVRGPDFPAPISLSEIVTTSGSASMFLIGGRDDNGFIYKLDCSLPLNSWTWEKLEQTLKTPRDDFVAMMVPSNVTNCQETTASNPEPATSTIPTTISTTTITTTTTATTLVVTESEEGIETRQQSALATGIALHLPYSC